MYPTFPRPIIRNDGCTHRKPVLLKYCTIICGKNVMLTYFHLFAILSLVWKEFKPIVCRPKVIDLPCSPEIRPSFRRNTIQLKSQLFYSQKRKGIRLHIGSSKKNNELYLPDKHHFLFLELSFQEVPNIEKLFTNPGSLFPKKLNRVGGKKNLFIYNFAFSSHYFGYSTYRLKNIYGPPTRVNL
ncbi:hypothetical protein RF11_14177 [Thelohanellus kitauei]|uniref:Uncharacterized protein n=1 Tax=Thelohanellus kitauei TaxID=669202 RepID=A0A0C2NE48_THEKT|nr:hypothetical protein RF11_14177 [Thelohanellus kitauei]